MGDLKEISTWPGNKLIFYKITSSGFVFDVRTEHCAGIGLARKPGMACDVWVVIGYDIFYERHRTWIKKINGGGKSCHTPNILSGAEYRRFWLSWSNGIIRLGRGHEKECFISYAHNIPDLQYITFAPTSRRNHILLGNVVHWRFELPPALEKPVMKDFTDGDLQWVRTYNHIPDGALIGGYEKETLYIIKANHQGALTPGKYVPSQGLGYISWGGGAHIKRDCEFLCGFNCFWVPTCEDRIPVGAVEGGYSEGTRETLYVGRALCNGHLIPGKVQATYKCCFVPFGGKEVAYANYEILVSPNNNIRSSNRQFIDHINVGSPPASDNEEDEGNAHEAPAIDMLDENNYYNVYMPDDHIQVLG